MALLLKFESVNYINDGQNILKDINMEVDSGDFISIGGHSGSGKSTLLKLCCHLISPTSGTILYKSKNILQYEPTQIRQNIAYCFQIPYLFGETVLDNIKFPFSIRNLKVDDSIISHYFSKFEMDIDYLKKDVINLSGGEKQRIALIRTLLFNPDILLLDEVTASLDVDNTIIVENVIKELNKEGTTVLWITHNPKQNLYNANKRLIVENGAITALEVLR